MRPLYEKFSGNELKVAEKIQQRRLQILIHSYIYYKKDSNIVSDATWAKWGKELVKLQNEYPKIAKEVMLYTDFFDFDGSTGAFLPLDEPWVGAIAERLMKQPSKPRKVEKPKTASNRLF